MCSGMTGTCQEKWKIIKENDAQRMKPDDMKFEILKWDAEVIEYDVSYCKYAELFRSLSESELGVVLVCDSDKYLTEEVTGPEVTYTRTQTLMQGGCICDVRWRIKKTE